MGLGALPVGLFAAGGALVAGYTAGATKEHIANATSKAQGLASSVGSTVSSAMGKIANIGKGIANIISGITNLMESMAEQPLSDDMRLTVGDHLVLYNGP